MIGGHWIDLANGPEIASPDTHRAAEIQCSRRQPCGSLRYLAVLIVQAVETVDQRRQGKPKPSLDRRTLAGSARVGSNARPGTSHAEALEGVYLTNSTGH
jgi:hypothetical protein